MQKAVSADSLSRFFGAAHDFASAVSQVFEDGPLREATGGSLTPGQWRILELVAQAEGITVSDVAYLSGVSTPAASKAIDKLVRRKLLHREEPRGDRRAIPLGLTRASRELLRAYQAARKRRAAEISRQVPPERIQAMAQELDELLDLILNRREAEPDLSQGRSGPRERRRPSKKGASHG